MIGIFSKNRYIYCWIYGDLYFILRQSEIVLDRYISEKPKGRANKSKERAKRRVGRARSKKEGAPQEESSSAAMFRTPLAVNSGVWPCLGDLANSVPTMGVAAPRAVWVHDPLKS